jgi:hypothetical protein
MLLFDISDPAHPHELGCYDSSSAKYTTAVLSDDSLAYVSAFETQPREVFSAVDIRDPSFPVKVGAGLGFNPVEAMALRDSFLYCAEDYKFEVFNVANPRQPVWRGRCDAYSSALGIDVQGTLAYVAPRLQIFDVADPGNPTKIHEESGSNRVNGRGIAVRDTFAYFLSNYDTLWVYSVHNPFIPRIIGWVPSGSHRGFDLVLRDSYAYGGCQDFRVYEVSSSAEPTPIGYYTTPYYAMGLDLDSQYVYVACYLAGVEVLEMLPVGIAEPGNQPRRELEANLRAWPNPSRYWVRLSCVGEAVARHVSICDAAGRAVADGTAEPTVGGESILLNLGKLGRGVYFVRLEIGNTAASLKLVKQ